VSDDTPTERFDPKSAGQTPPDPFGVDPEEYPATRRLPASEIPAPAATPLYTPTPGDGIIPPDRTRMTPPPGRPPGGAPGTPGGTPPKKSRTLMWWLIGIGAALLVAVIVLLVMLLGNGGDETPVATTSPTASETPTPTPSATEEPQPTPTPTAEPVPSPTFATFSAPASANCPEGEDEAPLTFSWSSTDAVRAYLGVGTQNAALNPTVSDLEPTATYTDLPFDCSVASQVYTVTLEDASGGLASRTVTITR
jgi:hypothetical protein